MLPVVVVVQGSGKDAARERDRWQKFGEENGCVIVAPLFPINRCAGTLDSRPELTNQCLDGIDNYKRLVYLPIGAAEPIFFDRILLQILEEFSSIGGSIDISKFKLVGFSGDTICTPFFLPASRATQVCQH